MRRIEHYETAELIIDNLNQKLNEGAIITVTEAKYHIEIAKVHAILATTPDSAWHNET